MRLNFRRLALDLSRVKNAEMSFSTDDSIDDNTHLIRIILPNEFRAIP